MKKLFFTSLVFCMNMNLAETENGFDVIGIVARTSNQAETQGKGVIPKLWQQFFSEQILTKIPNKSDQAIIALYYDFSSDKNGEYSMLIGARVHSVGEIPAGMVTFHVPAEKKELFLTEKGPVSSIVIDTWQKLWSLEDQGKIKRTYKGDYELYDERSHDPDNAQVEIHIGVE